MNNEKEYKEIYYESTGDTYKGETRKSLLHGKGTFIFSSGDVYEGFF
jgi:hypothetical protein